MPHLAIHEVYINEDQKRGYNEFLEYLARIE